MCQLSFDSKCISRFRELQERPGISDALIPVLLPNLIELDLSQTPPIDSGIEVMLSWIKIASSLKRFRISSTGQTRTPFENFFTAPSSLTSLPLYRVEMPAAEFSGLLAILIGLRLLAFDVDKGITNDYLEPLCDHTCADFTIVPKLQYLILGSTWGSRYDDETLLSLLELRWKNREFDSYIKYVNLDRRTITSKPVRSRLDKLRGEGMQIVELDD
ncbi:hypothetical protein L218DRAFT_963637 [Marasmius fiardii PR-910]|nr:hypothetical protein L218DRAFT_963637 [Marasmius fiardii PR-910]